MRIKEWIIFPGKSSQISSNICLIFLESRIYHQVVVIFPENRDFRESRLTEVDVDTACVKWKTIVLELFDKHAPAKVDRVKDRCNPWITKDIM